MRVPKSPLRHICNATIFCLFFLISHNSVSQQLAFPTAKGAGAYASGGRGGQVIHVTTLNWDGPGSLKRAIQTTGARTIVFDVSGEIDATAMGNYETLIRGSAYDNMTIAGQSAPLGGITIKTTYFLFEEVDNIIIRYIRFRNVDIYNNSDASWFQGANNLILDHCTFSHGNDECLDVSDSAASIPSSNVTIQNCFLQNSKTGTILGSQYATGKFTFANNAISSISHRFPNIGGTASSQTDVVNNVIYNWQNRLVRLTYGGKHNIINNYYKTSAQGLRRSGWYPGSTVIPATNLHRIQAQDSDNPLIYTAGSIITGQRETPRVSDSDMWSYFDGSGAGYPVGGAVANRFFTATQFPLAGRSFSIKTANQAYIDVLADVGANHYLNADGSFGFYQDTKDAGDILMIQNDTFVSYESNNFTYVPINLVPYPTVPSNTRPSGFYASNANIPQVWFQAHVPAGQNHNNIAPSGYTWLEEYLNGVDGPPVVTIGVQSVAVNPPTAELQIAETIQLTKTFTPANATNQNGIWASSNAGIATVSATGLVTAISVGEVIIRYTSTDGNFTDTSLITILPEPLQASAGNDQQICENESTTLTATGGTTYLWSTGDTTASITVNPSSTTTFSVTAYDATGNNSDTDDVVVTVNALPNVNAGADVTIIVGNLVTLTASGANTYLWNTGQTTSSITVNPLTISTYTVTGTNTNGCEDTDSVTVFLIDTSVNANAGSDISICAGENTTLSATGGYSYLWNTGATTASITVNPNSTTTYTVTTYGLLGLNSDTDEVIVTVNPLPTVDAGSNMTINLGESVTLGATGASSYLWNTGASTQNITVSPILTTTYTVTGTSNGCNDSDTVTITVIDTSVNADAGIDVSICEGNTTTLTATGGATYQWNTGATTASITVSPNATTTYTVTAFDATGSNSDTDNVIVTVNPAPNANAGQDTTICKGTSVTLTASGGGSYLWETGATTASITVSPNNTRIYTVEVTQNGCTDSDDVTVTVNSLPAVDAGPNVTINLGESTTLSASGANSYEWNTGATTSSIDVNPSITTIYNVTGTLNGCEKVDTVTVTVLTGSSVTANAGDDISICEGNSIMLNASGGSTYQWNTGETTGSITVSPNSTTTYTVTVFDVTGNNSDTDEVTVTVNPLPAANAGADVAICKGTSVTLTATGGESYLWETGATTASITVSPNNTRTYSVEVTQNQCTDTDDVRVTVNPLPIVDAGSNVTINLGQTTTLAATGANTYVWSTGATSSSITVSPSLTTTYSVTGTSNGCDKSDTVTVTVLTGNSVTANAGANVSICEGSETILTATGGASYLWNNGATTASITVSPSLTTTYTVTAYDSTGINSDTDDVTVTVKPLPTANAGVDISTCRGTSVTLTATGGTSYLWSNGATTASIIVSPNNTSTYTVEVTQNGCTNTDDVRVTVNQLPSVNAGVDVTINLGQSVTLNATGASTYVWSTGETTSSINVSPTSTTIYNVIGTNASGCYKSDAVTVNVQTGNTVTANAGENVSICAGNSTILTAIGGSTYLWSNGATTASITVSPSSTTSYTVTAYDSTGINSDTDDVIVTVNQPPTANAGPDVATCRGTSVILTATGGTSYLWSNGANTASITVNPNSTTTYTVEVTQNECTETDDVRVTVNALPTVNAGSDMTINLGQTVELNATGAITYAWSTGSTSASINVSPTTTTTYTVTGTNSNGCRKSDTVTVNVQTGNAVTANAGANVSICQGNSTTLTASGGATYRWSNGATSASISVSPNSTTTYTVTVYDAGGINSDTDDVIVTVNSAPTIYTSPNFTINSGQTVILYAFGANSYSWSNGQTGIFALVSPTITTTYTVIGTNTNGCQSTASVTITVLNASDYTSNAGADKTTCSGTGVTLTANGGNSYLWSTGQTTQSINVNPSNTTTYSVIAYTNTAEITDDVTVIVRPNPVVNILNGNAVTILEGEYVTLNATGANRYEWNNGATLANVAVNPSATTTYSVIGYIQDCSDSKAVTVNVVPEVVAFAGNDQTICLNEPVTLSATGGNEYLWSTGETTQSISVTPTEDTEYSVTVYNALDYDDANVMVFVNDCTSGEITEDPETYEFLVYPNPTSGDLNIKISGVLMVSSINMYDISGKMLFNETISAEDGNLGFERILDLSNYSDGIYILKLVDNQKTITKKIIVSR